MMKRRLQSFVVAGLLTLSWIMVSSVETAKSDEKTDSGNAAARPEAPPKPERADQTQKADGSEGDPAEEKADDDKILEGHSFHGEAFNEGPRQRAYLIPGTGNVEFPVTSKHPDVQKFINQGVGQLHGFWYFEAERSFRQAAFLDEDCAIAYWGMAMANANNEKRSKGFIEEAVERKEGASEREVKYIDALSTYLKADPKKRKERSQKYTKALEKIYLEYPDDLEAKAFLGLQLWVNRTRDLPITSHLAVNALLNEVLAVNPRHPVHHYRIHLWDYEKPEMALNSAADGGPSAPAIAHMWHMPGHIYSRLKRYNDAAWQQEASARVDHAQMIRDRILPDQIHNFAHNNEWLIRNLQHVGRVEEAIDLARNMIELPRHPKYNTIGKRGSTNYGRRRLFEVLSKFEKWDEMITLCNSTYLEPTDSTTEQVKRLRHLGRAYFRSGNVEEGRKIWNEIKADLEKQTSKRDEAVAKAEEKAKTDKLDEKKTKDAVNAAKRPFSTPVRELERAGYEMEGLAAVSEGEFQKGYDLLKKASGISKMYLALIQFKAGKVDDAIKAAEKYVDSHEREIQPLAALTELLWLADRKEEALKRFKTLQKDASHSDIDVPIFARLKPVAEHAGMEGDWRIAAKPAEDLGDRPELDSLGPFRWSPSKATNWKLVDYKGNNFSLEQFKGRPVVVIFYLGYGCLHCAEQLEAFAPKTEEYKKAGIELIAISTDDPEQLTKSHEQYREGDFPFPLVSNEKLDVFKDYRVFDDFESQPLHGTFLIDGNGLVRWQDISYEPFNEPEFVLKEAQRLLGHSAVELVGGSAGDTNQEAGGSD